MAQPLTRLQRAKLLGLRANVTRAVNALHAHRKICSACKPGSSFARHACDAGWQLAKDVARAENALTVYRSVDGPDGNPDPLTLF